MLKDKKRVLIIGVVICLVSLVVNTIEIYRHRIHEPIVLEHYLEVLLQEEVDIKIHYITNKRDDIKINQIYFPKHNLTFYNRGFEYKDELRYYNINTCIMKTHLTKEQLKDMEEIILEEAEITYNKGLMQKIDIGKIVANDNNRKKCLNSIMTSSSNTGFSKSVFEFKDQSIVIDDITSKFYEETQDFVKMNLITQDESGDTIFNISSEGGEDKIECYRVDELKLPFTAHERFSANTIFEMLDNDCKYNVYDIRYVIHFLYENGDEGSQSLYNIRYLPYFTDRLVSEIVKKKG